MQATIDIDIDIYKFLMQLYCMSLKNIAEGFNI